MKKYIYIHVCCINNWKQVFNQLYSTIKTSGLYNIITSIKCNILSTDVQDTVFFTELNDSKIEILGIHNDLNLYETPTINMLYEHSLKEDFYVLYLHTKGVRYNNTNINVIDWINYLIYFNIQRYETCVKNLLDYDTVGVNLHYADKKTPTHYSGNFWWSKSDYIRKLEKCVYTHYRSPEMWITEKNIGKYLWVWKSNVNHYTTRYEEHNYTQFTMKLYYGVYEYAIDITDICLSKFTENNIISIPIGDVNRAYHFTDPAFHVSKKIIILQNGDFTDYDQYTQIKINTLTNTLTVTKETDINCKLRGIHSKLCLNYGSFNEEFPEQQMAARYLEGHEKVLEIGANIGRNSLIIASLLEDSKNLVSLECDVNIAKQLAENRDANNLGFHIENSALSNRKLIQKGWDTIPSDVLIEDYNWVDTISLVDLKAKYNIVFDTLVLDCEGAFYYILMDMPEILDNIKLIIMKNDYWNKDKKKYIDNVLVKNRFYVDYSAPLLDIYAGYTGPYVNNFYEVWKRVI